jgi:serine/threonine-protein kinase
MAVAALAVLVLLLAAGGGWVLGLWSLPQRLPVAAPYTFTAERAEAGGPRATGHVPSAAVQTAIAERMAEQGGQAELELATGAISESWGSDVVELLDLLAPLAEWRLAVRDNAAEVSGLTADRDLRARLNAAALPAGLTGRIEIALGPRRLPAASVQAVLDRLADCGPLVQQDPPAQGYPMGAPVLVSGRLAAAPARVQLYDALAAIAGDRKVVIDAEVLNPALCQIEAQMPAAPPGGIQVEFGFGDRPGPNPGGRYFVGENPVIDVVIPEGLDDGFLWVSILDVTGNVYHLLPNLNRPDNSIAALRAGRPGAVPVRVAFSLAEAEAGGKLAFLVDDSTLGKSKVVVIHSARQIFDELRPTTESAAGYAEALASHATGGMARDITLDSRILTTAAK